MQIELLTELPPNGGYENITTIDVCSSDVIGYTVCSPEVVNTAKIVIDILPRHAHLPTVKKRHKGSVFVSNVIHKIVDVLATKVCHATTKHAQTIVKL